MKLNHLAIIMDGNRRWAISNNLPSYHGHQKGGRRGPGQHPEHYIKQSYSTIVKHFSQPLKPKNVSLPTAKATQFESDNDAET